MFDLENIADRSELLKNGLSINNQNKTIRDYINREKLIYKCYTCNKIGYLTKNCKLKDKIVPSVTVQIILAIVQKQYGNAPIVTAIIVLLIADALL